MCSSLSFTLSAPAREKLRSPPPNLRAHVSKSGTAGFKVSPALASFSPLRRSLREHDGRRRRFGSAGGVLYAQANEPHQQQRNNRNTLNEDEHPTNSARPEQEKDGEGDFGAPPQVDTSRPPSKLSWALAIGAGLVLSGGIITGVTTGGISLERVQKFGDYLVQLGPTGKILYGLLYTALEIVAVPALPLTIGGGYLFGQLYGTIIVSASSTTAAALSFLIARYALRDAVGKVAYRYPQFRAVDKAVSREGFKFTLLLRLSPIFPFALSNYLYGLTSLRFPPYIFASWLGMLPGTIAYVYGGAAAEELTSAASGRHAVNLPLLGMGAAATVLVLYNLSRVASDALAEEQLRDSKAGGASTTSTTSSSSSASPSSSSSSRAAADQRTDSAP